MITLEQLKNAAQDIINDDEWVNDSHSKAEHDGIKSGLTQLIKHFEELEQNKLQTVKIQSDDDNIHLDCPNCDMWEQLGINDPRKMLNAIPIINWVTNKEDKNYISLHECTQCKIKFKVEWDYNNPINK